MWFTHSPNHTQFLRLGSTDFEMDHTMPLLKIRILGGSDDNLRCFVNKKKCLSKFRGQIRSRISQIGDAGSLFPFLWRMASPSRTPKSLFSFVTGQNDPVQSVPNYCIHLSFTSYYSKGDADNALGPLCSIIILHCSAGEAGCDLHW